MKRLAVVLLFAASGCTWIGNTADNVGEHMPVIGERCEHWQCVTSSGQARSNENKTQMAKDKAKQAAQPPAPPPEPPPAANFPSQPSRTNAF